MAASGDEAELARLVREADPERYISTLYAPPEKRPALLAFYAFDAEVSGIRARVREALPGEIRLQWWRDTIANGVPVGHPVADALNAAIAVFSLPGQAFENLLEARIFDLYDDPMPGRTDLEGYLGETDGALIQLAALILAPESASQHAAIAGHAGCARGIVKLLLRLPADRARSQCFLPRDLLASVGTTPDAFVTNTPDASREKAVEALHALGGEHHRRFLEGASNLPPALRPAFLPLATVPAWLDALRDPARVLAGTFRPIPLWRRHLLILRRALSGWSRA